MNPSDDDDEDLASHTTGPIKKRGLGRLLPNTLDVARVRDTNHAATAKVHPSSSVPRS